MRRDDEGRMFGMEPLVQFANRELRYRFHSRKGSSIHEFSLAGAGGLRGGCSRGETTGDSPRD